MLLYFLYKGLVFRIIKHFLQVAIIGNCLTQSLARRGALYSLSELGQALAMRGDKSWVPKDHDHDTSIQSWNPRLFSIAAYSALGITKGQRTRISLAHSPLLEGLCDTPWGSSSLFLLITFLSPHLLCHSRLLQKTQPSRHPPGVWTQQGWSCSGPSRFTAHTGSAHPAHTQQARCYKERALPYGLPSTEGNALQPVRPRHRGTTAVAEQGNEPIKYLIEFLVHMKACWLLPRLRSACCHLAMVWLQRV